MNERDKVEAAALAQIHVDRALALIEDAQHTLERACAELSPIVGMVPEWTKTSKLTTAVHQHWYRVRTKAEKLRGRGRGALLVDDCALAYARRQRGDRPPVLQLVPKRGAR